MIGVRQVMPEQEKGLTFKSPALIPNTDSSAPLSLTFNGRSLVLNQFAPELNSTNWSTMDSTASYADGIATFTATANKGRIKSSTFNLVQNHKYLFSINIKLTSATTDVRVHIRDDTANTNFGQVYTSATTNLQNLSSIFTYNYDYTGQYIQVLDGRTSGWDAIQVQAPAVIDLTLMFGLGKEPTTVAQLKSIIDLDSYIPYNPGMLIHANNEWDIDRFNQLVNYTESLISSSYTVNDVTITNNKDGSFKVNGTASAQVDVSVFAQFQTKLTSSHVYLFLCNNSKGSSGKARITDTYGTLVLNTPTQKIITYTSGTVYLGIQVPNGTTCDNDLIYPQCIDLTDIFGAGKEPTSVDVAKAYFKGFGIDLDTYQPYTPLGSVYSDNGRVDLGFNIWDEEWENGIIINGANSANSSYIRSKNYIPVEALTTYFYRNGTSATGAYAYFSYYNANKTYLSTSAAIFINSEFSTPANTAYIRFYVNDGYGNVYNNDICINKSLPTTTNNAPYNFRKTNTSVATEDREDLSIVGGTVAWNQYASNGKVVQFSKRENTEKFFKDNLSIPKDHIILVTWYQDTTLTSAIRNTIELRYEDSPPYQYQSGDENYHLQKGWYNWLFKTQKTLNSVAYWGHTPVWSGDAEKMSLTNINISDLTVMFGSSVADYIYSLGNTNGVAYFRNLFPKQYYSYNAGELISVNTSAHTSTGLNQWDEQWELGTINNSTGQNEASTSAIRCKNYIRVLPSTTYCATNLASDKGLRYYWYDENKTFISSNFTNKSNIYGLIDSPSNAYYLKIRPTNNYGKTYNHDICINISNSAVNGAYEPYQTWSYPLDSTLTLRGIPKKDANNNLYYDGDTYKNDGTVIRKYSVVDLGTLNWTLWNSADPSNTFYTTSLNSVLKYTYYNNLMNIVCAKYVTALFSNIYNQSTPLDKVIVHYNSDAQRLCIRDSAYTDATTFKSSLSGVYLVYERKTSTSEQAFGFTVPQKVNAYGTEEFVDTRDVAIPVENNTIYFHHGNLYNGKYLPYYPMYGIGEEFNIWDEQWESGSINAQGELVTDANYCRSKNYTQIFPNTTYCLKNTTNSGLWLYYYDSNKTFIPPYSSSYTAGYRTFVTPANAYYIKMVWYSTSYDNGTCINLSQSNTSVTPHNGQYRPYPIKNTFDCISGELVQRVGIVDLGTLTWTLSSSYANTFYTTFSAMKHGTNQWVGVNNKALCEKYLLVASDPTVLSNKTGTLNTTFVGNSSNIVIKDTSYSTAADFKAALSGVMMVYELATPVTSTKIPQPVALLNGQFNKKYGVVDLGSLNWSYSSSTHRMYIDGWASAYAALLPIDDNTQAHLMCAKYVTATAYQTQYNQINQAVSLALSGALCVYDTTYTNANDFKAAMQGIYLIYELAQPVTGTPTYATSANYIREVEGGVKGMSATIDYYFAYNNVRGKLLRYGNKIIVLEGGEG